MAGLQNVDDFLVNVWPPEAGLGDSQKPSVVQVAFSLGVQISDHLDATEKLDPQTVPGCSGAGLAQIELPWVGGLEFPGQKNPGEQV